MTRRSEALGAVQGAGGASGDDGAWVRVPCNSCDGYLEGTEPGGVCEGCLRDWEDWRRAERAANEWWVRKMMAGGYS